MTCISNFTNQLGFVDRSAFTKAVRGGSLDVCNIRSFTLKVFICSSEIILFHHHHDLPTSYLTISDNI